MMCVNCGHFERIKRKGAVGICPLHGVLVLDTLCGCECQDDGIVKLLNFELDNDKKG